MIYVPLLTTSSVAVTTVDTVSSIFDDVIVLWGGPSFIPDTTFSKYGDHWFCFNDTDVHPLPELEVVVS